MASKLNTLVEKDLIKEGKIPKQELDSQRGEGAYFWRRAYFRDDTVIRKSYYHTCSECKTALPQSDTCMLQLLHFC